MRRAWRYIINGLTILSLLVCVGTIVLWVRSFYVAERWGYDSFPAQGFGTREYYAIEFRAGGILLVHSTFMYVSKAEEKFWDREFEDGWKRSSHRDQMGYPVLDLRSANPANESGFERRMLGFQVYEWHREGWPTPEHYIRRLTMPCWSWVGLLLILPAARFVRWRRRRNRRKPGQCAGCGYDLRATPERCPECGVEAR